MPKTAPGKWSVWLIVAFIVLFVSFILFVASGQRGGQEFFDNLLLAIPGLLAGIAGVVSFFTGLVSVIGFRERSILVYPAMLIGLLVLLFVVGEISFPH
jgi:type II secretory pathway component PulF